MKSVVAREKFAKLGVLAKSSIKYEPVTKIRASVPRTSVYASLHILNEYKHGYLVLLLAIQTYILPVNNESIQTYNKYKIYEYKIYVCRIGGGLSQKERSFRGEQASATMYSPYLAKIRVSCMFLFKTTFY